MTIKSAASVQDQPRSLDLQNPQADGEHVLGGYIPLVYHYNMLQDQDRVMAFREAIETVVRPGMHVLELGGGTGILSSFAARCGAKVTCVERIPELVRCARNFIQQNALKEAVEVVEADASIYVPSAPVDVVICEMLHVGLLREKQMQVIAGFKRGYSQKFGNSVPMFLPEVSILMAQAVEQSFDFEGYWAPLPMFQATQAAQPRTREMSALSVYANIDYQQDSPLNFHHCETIAASQSGNVNAVRFLTQNVVAVDLQQQRAITWPNQSLVIPVRNPLCVTEGQRMRLAFGYSAGHSVESLAESIELSLH